MTAVLIGAQTADREWVQYEIKRSVVMGNGILGIYIHGIKDRLGRGDSPGANPLGRLYYTREGGVKEYLSHLYPSYDWVNDDGYNNLGTWVEAAARRVGR